MAFWNRKREERSHSVSISDPAFVDFFGLGRTGTGVFVNEHTALTLSAVWRAVSLISGTVAGLPLKTFRTLPDDTRERVGSFLDNPAGPNGMTVFAWVELLMIHLLLHGNAFLLHITDGLGRLLGLQLIHPQHVSIDETALPEKRFTVTLHSGETIVLTPQQLTHIMALTLDGVRGLSPISVARESLGIYRASEFAAARMFGSGLTISGFMTPRDDEDLTEDDALQLKESLRQRFTGLENAGDIPVVNRRLEFHEIMMSSRDAEFLDSRKFQIDEVARWFGIAPHLLMNTETQSNWGTGIEEQHRALSRHTLMPWTKRVEQALSKLLVGARFAEFDHTGLQQPTSKDEVALLVTQIQSSLLTVNEARRIRNLPPLEGGDIPQFDRGAGELFSIPVGAEETEVE